MSRILRSIERLYRMSVISLMNRLRRHGWFGGNSWSAWRVVAKAMLAEPLSEDEQAIFAQISGGRRPPTRPVRELWLVVGRRGGKSLFVAFLAFYCATCGRYRLAPGERGVVMIVASDRKQGRVLFRYTEALFSVEPFAKLIERKTQEAIYLTNGLVIEIHTASFRSIRGYTVVCFLGDEAAFWSADGSNPDAEIFAAARPATATNPHALIVGCSSPYARRGLLWEMYKKHFGKDSDDVLVVQAPSLVMNSSLPESIVAQAYEDDPASAAAEYGAEFRSDIESYVRKEAVDACVVPGRFEQPAVSRIEYCAGFDAAGGSGQDEMTLAIGHYARQGERVTAVLDLVIGVKPPFSPETVVAEFCVVLKRYRVSYVHGDRYAGEWPREQFQKADIAYELTDKPKSDLYRELLPAINSGAIELLDDPKLIAQLCALERRTARGGRDTIDHPPNGHDDVINSAAIALLRALKQGRCPEQLISYPGEGLDETVVPTVTRGDQEIDEAIDRELASTRRGFGRWFH